MVSLTYCNLWHCHHLLLPRVAFAGRANCNLYHLCPWSLMKGWFQFLVQSYWCIFLCFLISGFMCNVSLLCHIQYVFLLLLLSVCNFCHRFSPSFCWIIDVPFPFLGIQQALTQSGCITLTQEHFCVYSSTKGHECQKGCDLFPLFPHLDS